MKRSTKRALRRAAWAVAQIGFLVAFVALLIWWFSRMADARPPENPDPALAPWFQSLRNPATDISCCALYDGHIMSPNDVRVGGKNDYQIRIAGRWHDVPKDAVLDRIDNPTGGFVAFYDRAADSDPSITPFIYCFIRPAMT